MEYFDRVEPYLAAFQLIFAMLGMGATLHARDFYDIGRRPTAIGIVLVAQFLVFPITAVVVAQWVGLPPGVALGLLVLAVMPSGAFSNIFTHLSRGNLALSITATVASTMVCLPLTPLLLRWLGTSSFPADFVMPTGRIIVDVVSYLLLPVGGGMLFLRLLPAYAPSFAKWTIQLSLVALFAIVVGSIGSGRINIWHFGWFVPLVLILYCFFQFVLTRLLTMGLKFSSEDSFTMAIEVAIRNGNLAILLGSRLFPPGDSATEALGAGTLYVALFYGGASLVMASLAAGIRRRRTSREVADPQVSASP